MRSYYVTVTDSMPFGSGYWEIRAENEDDARRKAFERLPEGRWSFMYTDFENIHPLDRRKHGIII